METLLFAAWAITLGHSDPIFQYRNPNSSPSSKRAMNPTGSRWNALNMKAVNTTTGHGERATWVSRS